MDKLVSCVMPACFGEMALLAVQCFLTQTYSHRELIVLDNNEEGNTIELLLPDDERIKYYRVEKQSVGALRNLGNSLASGEVICNWDCDDWYTPTRIEEQVKRLEETGLPVTGWHNILYYSVDTGNTYKYFIEPSGRNHAPYAMGTSHCYLKTFWEKHKYPTTGIEDFEWQKDAMHRGLLDSTDAGQLCVVRYHGDSVCGGQLKNHLGQHRQFPSVERSLVPQQFFLDLASSITPNFCDVHNTDATLGAYISKPETTTKISRKKTNKPKNPS